MKKGYASALGLLAMTLMGTPAAIAQDDITLAGQTVRVIIGSGVGGGYDSWGRVVANHIGKHLPGNPEVIAENMPGAGSLVAANHIYNIAPKDGTMLAIIARDAPMEPLLGNESVQFDPRKFTWVGSTTTETNICFAHSSADIASVDDLRANELIVGDTGPATGSYKYPKGLADILDLNFRVISGFPASADVTLAIERGEVEGMCESLDSLQSRHPEWIEDGTVAVLFQGGLEADPALEGIPLALDLARNEEERQAIAFLYAGQFFGRPFIAPPDLQPGRAEMLRTAFDATMEDPEFIAEAAQRGLKVAPVSGSELAAFIDQVAATPKQIVDYVIEITQ